MYQLIESICIENKSPRLIDFHNDRFNRSCHELFGITKSFDLSKYIELPAHIDNSCYKYRILFNGKTFTTQIRKYVQKTVYSLKVVHCNNISYSHKTDQRELLNQAFEQRGECDDVIIVKNNRVTDGFSSNILLFDGTQWITPSTPLLKGTQREFLLIEKQISEKDVFYKDIVLYKRIKLINAMIPFDRAPEIDISGVVL